MDADTAQVIEEKLGHQSNFATELLNEEKYKDCAVLFEIDIEGRGTIILDLFQRPSKFNQTQVSTLTEVGSSTLQEQQPVAYVVDAMDRSSVYLSYDQVRTVFHEFGHALNIALSNTKYQYHSCARASLEVAEIPSHYVELYLKDYSFVKKWAFQPLL